MVLLRFRSLELGTCIGNFWLVLNVLFTLIIFVNASQPEKENPSSARFHLQNAMPMNNGTSSARKGNSRNTTYITHLKPTNETNATTAALTEGHLNNKTSGGSPQQLNFTSDLTQNNKTTSQLTGNSSTVANSTASKKSDTASPRNKLIGNHEIQNKFKYGLNNITNSINLLDFMKPEGKKINHQSNFWTFKRHHWSEFSLKSDSNDWRRNITAPVINKTEPDPMLVSFFDKEEDNDGDDDGNEYITRVTNDGDNEYLQNDGDDSDNDGLFDNNNPVLSSLITNKEIEGLNNGDMSDVTIDGNNKNILQEVPLKRNGVKKNDSIELSKHQESLERIKLTQNVQTDLEDPDDTNKTPVFQQNNSGKDNNIDDLLDSYYKIHGTNLTSTEDSIKLQNIEEQHQIRFIRVQASSGAHCMDGSTPGYFLREGYNTGKTKWIVHLHGGAWCYNLRSCKKRRNTILGSTKRSLEQDIAGFFHGILSNSRRTNHHFYNWNVAVLSYCDGGLFSGNREKVLRGNNKDFYFQGRKVLQSQLESLQLHSLENAEEVILSGTSAGGLALVIQGNFMLRYLPPKAKVRGLIDAGLFLDQDSVWNTSISSLQFKALYSLHRPTLSRRCLESQPHGNKYKCLFPENALKYVKMPVFLVSSLYDHWQLSYLEGVYCVYDDHKCERNAHDRILNFRNKIYNAITDIVKDKPDTGVFANSCFAHGQVILDYTWSHVKINNKSIANSFYDWYSDDHINQTSKKHLNADCKYPCNGSCPKSLSKKCVNNFIKASEHRRKRDAELC